MTLRHIRITEHCGIRTKLRQVVSFLLWHHYANSKEDCIGCHMVHSSAQKYPTTSTVNGTKAVKPVFPPLDTLIYL